MKGFTGGLNTIDSPYTIQEDETRDCLNVVSTERGSIRKRYGSTQFLTPTIPNVELTSAFTCVIGGVQYMIVSNGEKLWSVTAAGAIAEIGSGFTAGTYWSMVQAPISIGVASQGPVYMVNGVDAPQYWTGATAATKVKEWTGVAANPKLTDGVATINARTLRSETAGFISADIGLLVKFETAVKSGGTEVKEGFIESVVSSKEVILAESFGLIETGWEATVTGVHFSIERNFYKEGKHVPNGQYMVFFGNRIWMTGIKADPSAVWFSELVSIGEGGSQGDPSQWPATNVVRFDSSDGASISGIGTVGPYLCVFKEFKTWIIHDINTGANRRLADTVGCVAHRSIVETTGGTFFLTADQGVYLTDGSKLHEMSYNIRPTLIAINPAKRAQAAGTYFGNHYYLSFASGTSTVANRTVDYDAQLKSWWLHDLTGNQWVIWEPTPGRPNLYALPPAVKAGVARAFVEGVYTDREALYIGNEGLTAYWKSAWDPFAYYVFRHRIEAPFLKKRVRQIFFNGEGQILPIVYKNFLVSGTQQGSVVGNKPQSTLETPTNFNASEESFGEGSATFGTEETLFGGEQTVGQARLYAPGVANVWSVGWGNKTAEPFVVDAFVYFVTFRKS